MSRRSCQEGEVVELVPLEGALADDRDDLDETERAALHAELEASLAEAKAGKLIDANEALAELRAMK
jgi:predicted transcriptional regulator